MSKFVVPPPPPSRGFGILLLPLLLIPAAPVEAQTGQGAEAIEEIVITGSRIRRNPLDEASPIQNIESSQLDETGLTNLGQALQQLPITGSAVNARFNVPGNSGFPQDGSGIGAGATQLALRNVNAKRTLVLVDGRRWVAGASASGVPSTVDLNSLPSNIIDRIEILQGGASAVYGSDAISGVVNVLTHRRFDGFQVDAQTGQYLDHGDGKNHELSMLWGGDWGQDSHLLFSLSYQEEGEVYTSDRDVSAFPNPNSDSCDVEGSRCSSFTPQGRFILGPNFNIGEDSLSITLNDGVLNDGDANKPRFDGTVAGGGEDFHAFTNADRFNYNGNQFNYLRTPNERWNIYSVLSHEWSDNLEGFLRVSYTKRESATRAAPEPLCLGEDCGTQITDNFEISSMNPYNPFGVDLSVENGNLSFFGRRPLESGPRLFYQESETLFVSAALEGQFSSGDRDFYWDLSIGWGDNYGRQVKRNSHNAANLQVAMGDPAVCEATPGCVPFNFFGGQGPDGTGSFTQEMLDFVRYTQRDRSEQSLLDLAFNISGDLGSLPAGPLGFAAGVNYRDQEGEFDPDPVAARAHTAGIPSAPTKGEFDVTEWYGELRLPLVADSPLARLLELNLALRHSDYSTSGSEETYSSGFLWQINDDLSLRGSVSTGFRAPGIGELFGGGAREDFSFMDPCVDYNGTVTAAANGRDMAQPANIIANCMALGVPAGLTQINPQLSAQSRGNEDLQAETSDSSTFGVVWSPQIVWGERLTFSVDFYDLEIEDAIQGRSPGELITACVLTLDPVLCAGVPRSATSGRIGVVNNQLQNIGAVESSGYDFSALWRSNGGPNGSLSLRVNATVLDEYVEIVPNPDGSETKTERTGTHTNETFERAFPELRLAGTLGWEASDQRWSGSLTLRHVGDMEDADGGDLDSVSFLDSQITWAYSDAVSFTFGLNNLLDEDPPVFAPSTSGISLVSHDIPGTSAYLRLRYRP